MTQTKTLAQISAWLRSGRLRTIGVLLVCAFVVAECAVRLVGESDADGNFVVLGSRLPPFRFPALRMREQLDEYLSTETWMRYSSSLGWVPREGSFTSPSGGRFYNNKGARVAHSSDRTEDKAALDVFRIVLIGDSFTHGDDIPFCDSIGALLQLKLDEQSEAYEVINLAVSGYGMDQALIRLQEEGLALAPDLVIFGYQPENIGRNLNLHRGFLWWKSQLPFSKPRFRLVKSRLEPVNWPTRSIDSLNASFNTGWDEDFLADEYFYDERLYASTVVRRSRLLGLMEKAWSVLRGVEWHAVVDQSPEGNPGRLALAIMAAMHDGSKASGANFLVVYLPRVTDITTAAGGGRHDHERLLNAISSRFELVNPEAALVKLQLSAGVEAMSAEHSGHYSRESCEVVASALHNVLRD